MVKSLLIAALSLIPMVTLEHHSGTKASFPELAKDRVTVVSVWATWCDACKKELTALNQYQPWTEVVKNPKFRLILISVDTDPKVAVEWVKENLSPAFLDSLYIDPAADLPEKFGFTSLPGTLLLNGTSQTMYKKFETSVLVNDIITQLGAK